MEDHLGAKKYERTDIRQGHRNGYKPRMLKTSLGTLNLLVPPRQGRKFFPLIYLTATREVKRKLAVTGTTAVKITN